MTVETLGYGTHLIIDGFSAEPSLLTEDKVRQLLETLQTSLEPGSKAKADVLKTDGGLSGALRLGEAHVSLHIFHNLNALSLRLFSRHALEPGTFSELLTKHFGTRRYESHLGNHSKTMAKEPSQRQLTLLGDRTYTALRLQEIALELT